MRKLIEICEGRAIQKEFAMASPVNFCLEEGERIAVYGPNGSGKSRLVEYITGRYRLNPGALRFDFGEYSKRFNCDNIKLITFRDSYGGATDEGYYYQKRWNQMDIDPEFVPTVRAVLEKEIEAAPDKTLAHEVAANLSRDFGLDSLLDKFVITLSSGELRKLQLTKALLADPCVLIIDNPFIGLDEATREQLSHTLSALCSRKPALGIILLVSRKEEIPDFVTHIVRTSALNVLPKCPYVPEQQADEVIRMSDIRIQYDERTIIGGLNWTVRKGEHWVVTGANGSGKSTLLSLICADNPQAYACNISLFGRRRGTGESIWDIKKRIGFVSPELHRSFKFNLSVREVVESGHFDTLGIPHSVNPAQQAAANQWMEKLGIAELSGKPFQKCSSGEQRLALLARAFVKDPELLVLDEPMHGLDDFAREKVRALLDDYFVSQADKTLIMVTHYWKEMPACIDRYLMLSKS